MIKTTGVENQEENSALENTAEAGRISGLECEIQQSSTNVENSMSCGGGFMIGKNKLQISSDKLKAAELLMNKF